MCGYMCDPLGVDVVQVWINSTDEQVCYDCGACSFTVVETFYDEFLVDPGGSVSPYRVALKCASCGTITRVNLEWSSVAEIDPSVVVAGVI